MQIAQELKTSDKILVHFKKYLEGGYYPFTEKVRAPIMEN